jgi:hypothetical protein
MAKEAFNGVIMTRARYTGPAGGTAILALEDYRDDPHKDRLQCLHCDAKIFYHAGVNSKDGDNSFQSPHFHTNPGQKHSNDCENGKQLHRRRRHHDGAYDKNLGYRFNIDMRAISGLYDRGHIRKPFHESGQLWPNELYDMEPVAIHSAADFAARLPHLDIARINNSAALWHKQIIPWRDFFIRGQERFPRLIDRLRRQGQRLHQPVMLYIHPEREIAADHDLLGHERQNIVCAPIRHPDLGNFKLVLSLTMDKAVRPAIALGAPLLVICHPRLFLRGEPTLHMSIHHAANIAPCDLNGLFRHSPEKPAPALNL